MVTNSSETQSINEYVLSKYPKGWKDFYVNKEGAVIPKGFELRREFFILKSAIRTKMNSAGAPELYLFRDGPYPFGTQDSYAEVPLMEESIQHCLDNFRKPSVPKNSTLLNRLTIYYDFIGWHVRFWLNKHAQWNAPFIYSCPISLLASAITVYLNASGITDESPVTVLFAFMIICMFMISSFLFCADKFENPFFVAYGPYLNTENDAVYNSVSKLRQYIAVLKQTCMLLAGVNQSVLGAALSEVFHRHKIFPYGERTIDTVFKYANDSFANKKLKQEIGPQIVDAINIRKIPQKN